MNRSNSITRPLIFLKHLNVLIILYIGFLTILSIRGILARHEASSLISYAGVLPFEAWKTLVLGIGYYACILLLMVNQPQTRWISSVKMILEIIVGILLCSALHFGYKGVILIIMADAIQYEQEKHRRMWTSILMCIVYIMMDERFIQLFFPIVPLKTMWMFFDSQQTALFITVLNVLNVINLFGFITYIVALFVNQRSERRRIFKLYQELEAKNEQLVQYACELELATKARERNRLAREIHDTLGHALTGIITGIDACVMLMDVAPEATKIQLKSISDVARQGIKDVRRSINALRPDALENIDLYQALEQMIHEMETSTGVKIEFTCQSDLKEFSQDEEDIVYRIIQESITNGIRHGKAMHIRISIEKNEGSWTIEVHDNGIGCKDVKKGFGLHHMEERLQMLNGELQYEDNNGFVIRAKIPIRWVGGENG